MKNKKFIFVLALLFMFSGFFFVGCCGQTSNVFSIEVVKVGEGTVIVDETAEVGEVVHFTAQANAGYVFESAYANSVEIAGTSFVMPRENVTLFVYFMESEDSTSNFYSINVVKVGEGTVNVSPNAESESTVNFTAQANAGYTLGGVYANNQKVSGTSFVMPKANVTLFVYFTSNQVSEQPIALKQGAYVARVYGELDYNSSNIDDWSTYTIAVNVKANNKVDVYGTVIDSNLLEITDQTYTREGNKIVNQFGGINFNCEIIDENTFLFISDEGDVVLFSYQEQVNFQDGTYQGHCDLGDIKITISGNSIAINVASYDLNMTYKIIGDRLYMTDTDDQTKYAAAINMEINNNFSIIKIGRKGEGKYDWEILYNYVHFSPFVG